MSKNVQFSDKVLTGFVEIIFNPSPAFRLGTALPPRYAHASVFLKTKQNSHTLSERAYRWRHHVKDRT